MTLKRNETHLERNKKRHKRHKTCLARNETRGGNLLLSGTVNSISLKKKLRCMTVLTKEGQNSVAVAADGDSFVAAIPVNLK